MKVISATNVRARRRLLDRSQTADPAVAEQAAQIVDGVRRRGDRGLREYARRFDKLQGSLEVTEQEIRDSAAAAPAAVRRALAQAARHIRRIAKRQVPREWRTATVPGVIVEQRVTALARVGCYVPGGRYPLPSSLLMTAVPARVAGVEEVIAVCPRPDPSVCAAALEAGVSRLFRIGGAHAVSALAYGTGTVPRVDKIVGPGNAYVAAAKAHVAADCPIDFFAGPTEIVIVADGGNASWIAADLVAQAEHDPDARALLLTPDAGLARAVAREVERQLEHHPAARQSIEQHGGAVVTSDLGEAVGLANAIAPEHAVCDDESTARALTRAGTVFVGPYGAQAAGDYATGSNHVLPTGGAARFRGGLSAADFVRVSSVQHLSGDGLRRLAPTAISLANAEGLVAHAASIAVRLR